MAFCVLWCFSLLYVAFPDVLGQLLGESSCTAVRKTWTLSMTVKPQAVGSVTQEYFILQNNIHLHDQ